MLLIFSSSALDDEMRQDSNMLDSWSRLHDLADDLMTVEGSSLEVVAHYKEKLETILMGEILNCSSQTNAQLLYGSVPFFSFLHCRLSAVDSSG